MGDLSLAPRDPFVLSEVEGQAASVFPRGPSFDRLRTNGVFGASGSEGWY